MSSIHARLDGIDGPLTLIDGRFDLFDGRLARVTDSGERMVVQNPRTAASHDGMQVAVPEDPDVVELQAYLATDQPVPTPAAAETPTTAVPPDKAPPSRPAE